MVIKNLSNCFYFFLDFSDLLRQTLSRFALGLGGGMGQVSRFTPFINIFT